MNQTVTMPLFVLHNIHKSMRYKSLQRIWMRPFPDQNFMPPDMNSGALYSRRERIITLQLFSKRHGALPCLLEVRKPQRYVTLAKTAYMMELRDAPREESSLGRLERHDEQQSLSGQAKTENQSGNAKQSVQDQPNEAVRESEEIVEAAFRAIALSGASGSAELRHAEGRIGCLKKVHPGT